MWLFQSDRFYYPLHTHTITPHTTHQSPESITQKKNALCKFKNEKDIEMRRTSTKRNRM